MKIVLKKNSVLHDCFVKINGMPILFDANSEAVVDLCDDKPFELELIRGEGVILLKEFDNETWYEKNRLVDKVIKKGVNWAVNEADKIVTDMSLAVNCKYEISGYADGEYIILEEDAQEPSGILDRFILDYLLYNYMYPVLPNAKGKLLSCEATNTKRVIKAHKKQYVSESWLSSGLLVLVEAPICGMVVRQYCNEKKVYKQICKFISQKNGF